MRRYGFLAVGLGLGLALAGLAFVWFRSTQPPAELHGLLLQDNLPAADFTLTAEAGRRVSLSDFRGRVVLLYFGYTFCPDVCPATLAEVKQAFKVLGAQAEELQLLMISVDPERDTPEKLADYVARFDPRFLGVTGTEAEIASATVPFGVIYQKHAGSAATGYLIDHTASLTVIDRQGYTRMIFPFGVTGEDLAADLRYLLSR